MINSRNLADLLPVVRFKALKHIELCHAEGIDLLVTSTLRDNESQTALYSQGRELKDGVWKVVDKKKIVTNAAAGSSYHNWSVAYDVVPIRNGKPVWGTSGDDGALWQCVGELGESVGLEWAGRWKSFKEFAHFQYTAGYTIQDFKDGTWDVLKFQADSINA
jgi:peptidoglycan L-alanyl-D-glutamate endopeptidase CwlK